MDVARSGPPTDQRRHARPKSSSRLNGPADGQEILVALALLVLAYIRGLPPIVILISWLARCAGMRDASAKSIPRAQTPCDCGDAGVPCSRCNTDEPPALPVGWRSIASTKDRRRPGVNRAVPPNLSGAEKRAQVGAVGPLHHLVECGIGQPRAPCGDLLSGILSAAASTPDLLAPIEHVNSERIV